MSVLRGREGTPVAYEGTAELHECDSDDGEGVNKCGNIGAIFLNENFADLISGWPPVCSLKEAEFCKVAWTMAVIIRSAALLSRRLLVVRIVTLPCSSNDHGWTIVCKL